MKTIIYILLVGMVFFSVTAVSANSASAQDAGVSPEELESIRAAAAAVVPNDESVEVVARMAHYYSKGEYVDLPEIAISAHLLEGHSPGETNPSISSDYTSSEKLRKMLQQRCAKIVKSVFTRSKILPSIKMIVIEIKHGVEQYMLGDSSKKVGTVAETMYSVQIDLEMTKDTDWAKLSEEETVKSWRVRQDLSDVLVFR